VLRNLFRAPGIPVALHRLAVSSGGPPDWLIPARDRSPAPRRHGTKIDRLLDEVLPIVNPDDPASTAKPLAGTRNGAFSRGEKGLNARKFRGFPQTVEGAHHDGRAVGGLGKHAREIANGLQSGCLEPRKCSGQFGSGGRASLMAAMCLEAC